MILSAHSIMGRRTNLEGSGCKDYAAQNLNYAGHTWATRWLLAALPRKSYEDSRESNFQILLDILVSDMENLFSSGVPALDGTVHYLAVVHVMGDWPFLAKAFQFNRSFLNALKHPSSKEPRKGICHHCQADQETYSFEDFSSPEPPWRLTLNAVMPFDLQPCLLRLPHEPANAMGFSARPVPWVPPRLREGGRVICVGFAFRVL